MNEEAREMILDIQRDTTTLFTDNQSMRLQCLEIASKLKTVDGEAMALKELIGKAEALYEFINKK